jgi:hydrogenase nickel incorporation protein HypB
MRGFRLLKGKTMCTVCGCGEGETKIEGGQGHEHRHADGTAHSHAHGHGAAHAHPHVGFSYVPRQHHPHGGHVHARGDGHLHYGTGPAGAHAPGMSQGRMVRIEQDILSKNNAYADANRRQFGECGIFAVNLVSSPGSGKTTLLVKSIEMLKGRHPLAVIEGDQQTSNDAERIRAAGAQAIQVNTGKGCHLDAHMVGHAFERLDLAQGGLLLIENVGNLVCPAEFDLGEAHKVVILSVTEGEDKPLKYPNMFAASDLMLLTKVDLLPHLSFDTAKCIEYARRVNPKIEVMQVSSVSGAGMEDWLAWLGHGVAAARKG